MQRMVDIVLDSSAIINLINGECIYEILTTPDQNFYVGDLIAEQEILNPVQKVVVETLIEKGMLTLLN